MSNSLSAFCFRECPVRGLIIVFSESHVAWRSPSCGNGSRLHCFSLVFWLVYCLPWSVAPPHGVID